MDPEDLLPLPQAGFHIIGSLAEGERHGYAIMQEVAVRTEGKLRLDPGTLYGSIKRMLEDGLIAEHEPRAACGGRGLNDRRYSIRVESFARTSSVMKSGTFSMNRALRACRSSTRGWLQSTTP